MTIKNYENFKSSIIPFSEQAFIYPNLTTESAISTEDLTAIADSDYNAIAGNVIIPAGETTVTVEVEVIDDRTEEENESFALQISDLSGATFNNIVLRAMRSRHGVYPLGQLSAL